LGHRLGKSRKDWVASLTRAMTPSGVMRGLDPIKSGHDSFPCSRIIALALSMTRLRIPATLEIAPGSCRNDAARSGRAQGMPGASSAPAALRAKSESTQA
jgi:hypothetical protein